MDVLAIIAFIDSTICLSNNLVCRWRLAKQNAKDLEKLKRTEKSLKEKLGVVTQNYSENCALFTDQDKDEFNSALNDVKDGCERSFEEFKKMSDNYLCGRVTKAKTIKQQLNDLSDETKKHANLVESWNVRIRSMSGINRMMTHQTAEIQEMFKQQAEQLRKMKELISQQGKTTTKFAVPKKSKPKKKKRHHKVQSCTYPEGSTPTYNRWTD